MFSFVLWDCSIQHHSLSVKRNSGIVQLRKSLFSWSTLASFHLLLAARSGSMILPIVGFLVPDVFSTLSSGFCFLAGTELTHRLQSSLLLNGILRHMLAAEIDKILRQLIE